MVEELKLIIEAMTGLSDDMFNVVLIYLVFNFLPYVLGWGVFALIVCAIYRILSVVTVLNKHYRDLNTANQIARILKDRYGEEVLDYRVSRKLKDDLNA